MLRSPNLNRSLPHRQLTPELLDSLQANDPDAIRARRDLRMIHFLMGNERWMLRNVQQITASAAVTFVEIGAGDGAFSRTLAQRYNEAKIHAYDFQERPAHLPDSVHWHSGDIRAARPPENETGRMTILVCCMFMHHFRDDELALFRPWLHACDGAIFVEPWRNKTVKWLGSLLHPLCNHVTRHDMQASTDAGFCGNELAEALQPDASWTHQSSTHWRGAHRVLFRRHEAH